MLQNLIPSFAWIAPSPSNPAHPRKGKDQILTSGNADVFAQEQEEVRMSTRLCDQGEGTAAAPAKRSINTCASHQGALRRWSGWHTNNAAATKRRQYIMCCTYSIRLSSFPLKICILKKLKESIFSLEINLDLFQPHDRISVFESTYILLSLLLLCGTQFRSWGGNLPECGSLPCSKIPYWNSIDFTISLPQWKTMAWIEEISRLRS